MYNICNPFLRPAQLEFSGNAWLCLQVKLFSGESQGKLDFCSIHESHLILAHTIETFPPRSLSSHKPSTVCGRLNWNGSKKYIYNAFNFLMCFISVSNCGNMFGFHKKNQEKRLLFFFVVVVIIFSFRDLLVSISLKKPFCWGPQIHNRHNMSTVEIQCSLILFITKENLWIVVFGFAFFFFQEGADARELFYISSTIRYDC